MTDVVKLDVVIASFVKLRDRRAALKREFDLADEGLKASMEKLDSFLLRRMQEQGLETVRSDAGTAYISVKTRASSADWTATWAWLAEHGRLDMLEKRLSAKAVADFEEESGSLPPGVNLSREREVTVRRA